MSENLNPIKILITGLGCLLVFSIPVIGILVIWDFSFSNVVDGMKALFAFDETEHNYNFQIQAGEDALLTSSIIEQGSQTEITYHENPAMLIKIDSANIEGPVVYGHDGESLLREGFWHMPGSVHPGEKGISAIFGHRRYHLPPAKDTFYNLDKVNIGDRVEIKLSDGTWLEYTVIQIDIINPDQSLAVITEETEDYLVKFVTCTPLGTSEQRLVVTAKKTF